MDVRSLRMLLGWSREELAKRSDVSFASVYLIERMGTAGPKDDAIITRTLLKSHKHRRAKRLSDEDTVSLTYAEHDATTMHETEPESQSCRSEEQSPTEPCGDMDSIHHALHACLDTGPTPISTRGNTSFGGLDC